MNKQRWAQLSGLEAEAPVLMLEGNQPIYREDIASIIREELAIALSDFNQKKDFNDLKQDRVNKAVKTAMGFAGPGFSSNSTQNRSASRGAGGTIGFGGPGFM